MDANDESVATDSRQNLLKKITTPVVPGSPIDPVFAQE